MVDKLPGILAKTRCQTLPVGVGNEEEICIFRNQEILMKGSLKPRLDFKKVMRVCWVNRPSNDSEVTQSSRSMLGSRVISWKVYSDSQVLVSS